MGVLSHYALAWGVLTRMPVLTTVVWVRLSHGPRPCTIDWITAATSGALGMAAFTAMELWYKWAKLQQSGLRINQP